MPYARLLKHTHLDTKAEGEAPASESGSEKSSDVEEGEDKESPWTEATINDLLKEDYVSLLLQHDTHMSDDDNADEGMLSLICSAYSYEFEDSVFDLESYVPDSLYPAYENARTQVFGLLTKLGVVRDSGSSSEGNVVSCLF